jgi:hypothetical protein
MVLLRAALKSGALSFDFVRARSKTCESAPRALIIFYYLGQFFSVGVAICW